MHDLKNVDLIIIDCLRHEHSIEILKHCQSFFNFGSTKFFTDKKIKVDDSIELIKIDSISSFNDYSNFCLKLNDYISNDFVLTIQRDGFIINPKLWDDNFLYFDYLGAPWTNFDNYKNDIGNGGFSLRSKYFLEYSSKFKNTQGHPEDYFLNEINYKNAMTFGINYPNIDLALKFSVENFVPKINNKLDLHKSFGFHGKHLLHVLKMQKPDLIDLIDRIN